MRKNNMVFLSFLCLLCMGSFLYQRSKSSGLRLQVERINYVVRDDVFHVSARLCNDSLVPRAFPIKRCGRSPILIFKTNSRAVVQTDFYLCAGLLTDSKLEIPSRGCGEPIGTTLKIVADQPAGIA